MAMALSLPALPALLPERHRSLSLVAASRAPSSSPLRTAGAYGAELRSLNGGLELGGGGGARGARLPVRCSLTAAKDEGVPEAVSGRSSSVSSFNVLITGSTKGIGLALAEEFLRNGDNVIICSRSEERVQSTLEQLTKEFGEKRAWGMACDVRDAKSIGALADYVKSNVGHADIWINNAGTNAYKYKSLVDSDDADIMEIVETNTLGVMLCCRQAIRLMRDRPQGGHIFNMDGAGADGNPTPSLAVDAYGMVIVCSGLDNNIRLTKAELKQSNIRNVVVHNLSPGMVTTDLLMSGSDSRQAKFFINVLAEPAETVAKFLVPRVRAIAAENKSNSTYTRFLTGFKAYTQILARLLFKARKDRYVPED